MEEPGTGSGLHSAALSWPSLEGGNGHVLFAFTCLEYQTDSVR